MKDLNGNQIKIDFNVGAIGDRPDRQDTTIPGECHSPLHMQPKSLSSFISGYKSTTFKKNPLKWEMDKENPLNNPVGANGVHPLNYET